MIGHHLDQHILNHFQTMFSSNGQVGSVDFLEPLRGRISTNMNDTVSGEFTNKEINATLFQMHPTEEPSLDSMPLLFYQKYWHLIGDVVTKEVLKVLNSDGFLVSFNHTFITLISKNERVMKVGDFCLISLCNVLYKILAKVIANRLKLILPTIISETQVRLSLDASPNNKSPTIKNKDNVNKANLCKSLEGKKTC